MNKEQKEFHKSRREQFVKLIGEDSLAIIFGNTLINRSYDANYNFRQHKNFYYLTGFLEPDSVLFLSSKGMKYYDQDEKKDVTSNEILFVQEKDVHKETWTGVRLGKDNVKRELGIEDAKDNFDLPYFLNGGWMKKYKRVYTNFADLISLTGDIKEFSSGFIEAIKTFSPEIQLNDSTHMLGKMRRVKTKYELQMIQKACEISANSFNDTFKKLKPGMMEYQVQANLEYNYKIYGALENAYAPICASGNHANILHYELNNDKLKDGDLILIDSGSEYEQYCSDITRTYPINGKFTKEQREVYEIVLHANKQCIKKSKEGMGMNALKDFCDNILADGMVTKGILKNRKLFKKYTIHGVGHHIGLDTHDAVPYKMNKDIGDKLVVGDVITIEPGLYFPIGSKDVPKKYWGIGVRIEDNVVIGKTGCYNLTHIAVKEADDIERMMAKK